MTWHTALELEQLKTKQRETLEIDGQKLLLIWHDNQVHAIQSQCPHLKLPLTKATITEDCAIVCPFHKSAFDLTTGEVKCWSPWPPLVGKLLGKVVKPHTLKVYPTRIEGTEIQVDL